MKESSWVESVASKNRDMFEFGLLVLETIVGKKDFGLWWKQVRDGFIRACMREERRQRLLMRGLDLELISNRLFEFWKSIWIRLWVRTMGGLVWKRWCSSWILHRSPFLSYYSIDLLSCLGITVLGFVFWHRQNALVPKFLKVRHFGPLRGNYSLLWRTVWYSIFSIA